MAMRTAHAFGLVLALVFPAMGCTRYRGATALTPAENGSTWVYVQTNRERRTGVYYCERPENPGDAPRCHRVILDATR